MAREQRRYSDEERANAVAALAANGGNLRKTARELGIPPKTLEHWAKQERHPEAATSGARKKGPLADSLEEIAWLAVGLLPAALRFAPANQIATTLGIAIDKMRLLREQPTGIQQNVGEVTVYIPENGRESDPGGTAEPQA